nr:hypothetical protein [Tanacetum cinerariifolium]
MSSIIFNYHILDMAYDISWIRRIGKICKKVLDVPELVSKPDEADAAKVTEEEATLYTRSWPYLIELVTSKDEYVSFLLAVQAPLDV